MQSSRRYVGWSFVIGVVAGFVALAVPANAYKVKEIEGTIPASQKTGDSFQDFIRHFSRIAGVRVEDQTDEFGP